MANEYIRKTIPGAAPGRTIGSGISAGDTTIIISSATGWPDGSAGKFVVAIDRGQPAEEKILITSRTGTTLTVSNRGYDGTTAQSHSSGAAIECVLDAATIDQANRYVNLQTGKGDMVVHNGTNPIRLPGPTVNDRILVSDDGEASGMAWVEIPDVTRAASAPSASATPYGLWVDTTLGVIRTSDGAEWSIQKTVLVFASSAARTAALGATPPNGLFSAIGTQVYVSLGGAWQPVGYPVVISASSPDPALYITGSLWAQPV